MKNKRQLSEVAQIVEERKKDDKNFNHVHVYTELAMHESTYFRKLRRNQWTKSEKLHLEKILKVKFEH